jgi:hypothetical protein
MAQQQQQPGQWGQALGGQCQCQHLWQQQRQGVVLLACSRGGRGAVSRGLAAAAMTMVQQQWQPWQQGQALAKQRQSQHLRLRQGVVLRTCSATRLLLGLCPQRTRRGLVGAGGKQFCPWPVSAAAAGRERYAARATRSRRLAGGAGLHNNQIVRGSERSGRCYALAALRARYLGFALKEPGVAWLGQEVSLGFALGQYLRQRQAGSATLLVLRTRSAWRGRGVYTTIKWSGGRRGRGGKRIKK